LIRHSRHEGICIQRLFFVGSVADIMYTFGPGLMQNAVWMQRELAQDRLRHTPVPQDQGSGEVEAHGEGGGFLPFTT
jgi:hypothetical protein